MAATTGTKDGDGFTGQMSAVLDTMLADAATQNWNEPPADTSGTVAESDDAGASPAPPATPEPTAPATSDAAPAAAPVADPAAPDPAAVVDPFAGSEAYKYTLPDGTERTLDGVYRFPGEGLMVPEDKIGVFEQIAVERDQLTGILQPALDRIKQFETLGTWNVTGDDGQARLVNGREGVEAMRVSHARLEATLNTVIEALKSDLPSLISVNDQNQIVLAPDAIQNLMTRAELNEMRAEQSVRALIGRALTPATPMRDDTAAYAAQTPALIAQALTGSSFLPSVLTAEDVAEFSSLLPRLVRDATPAERASNPAQAKVVDAVFTQSVLNRAKLRADSATRATTAAAAGATNARTIQARQPAATPKPTTPPAAPTTSAKPRSFSAQSDDIVAQALASLNLA